MAADNRMGIEPEWSVSNFSGLRIVMAFDRQLYIMAANNLMAIERRLSRNV